MAQRYGGKYSPNQPASATDLPAVAPPQGVGLTANLLFVLPFLFFVKAFRGDPSSV